MGTLDLNLRSNSPRGAIRYNSIQLIISIYLLVTPSQCSEPGAVYVISEISNETVLAIRDTPAKYVSERNTAFDIRGYVVYADPPTACTKVKLPPTPYTPIRGIDVHPTNWVLLVKRSPDCHFQTKIENAQNSGYSAVIIHNVGSNDTEVMGVEHPDKLLIFATFIGEYDGITLKNYTFPSPYFLRIAKDFSGDIVYFYSLVIAVGICIMLMFLFIIVGLVVRWYRKK